MIKVRIHVTQDDIDRGYPCGGFICPIALAAIRIITPAMAHIQVDKDTLGTRFHREIPLPIEAVQFIHDFDNHLPVSPFSFVVEM